MKIAFIIDPLKTFNPKAETTFYLMHEMTQRGWDCYGIELKNLYVENGEVWGLAQKISVTKSKGIFSYHVQAEPHVNLAEMNAVWLRKDPPVDLNFIDHLSLLELLKGKVFLLNDPTGIKQANEKIFTLNYPAHIPQTLVSQNKSVLGEFIKRHQTVVLKPLNLSGGRGIVKVKHSDPSLSSIIDILTDESRRYIIAQKFVPAALKGDKRILVLDGKILGSFLRVPKKNDFRGNLHSGAELHKCPPTAKDKKLVQLLTPRLREMGLHFVGLDLLGDFLTEINVTSPMGLGELNQLSDAHSEKTVVEWLQLQILDFQKENFSRRNKK